MCTNRRIKEGDIQAHTNAIKSFITNEIEKVRQAFCLQELKQVSLSTNFEFKKCLILRIFMISGFIKPKNHRGIIIYF